MFHVQEIAFLGFVIDPDGAKMDPMKVEAIILPWEIIHIFSIIEFDSI